MLLSALALAAPHVDVAGGYAGGALHAMVLEAEDEELLIFDWGHGPAARLGAGWLLEERLDVVVGLDVVDQTSEGWRDLDAVPAPGRLLRASAHLRLPYWQAGPVRPYLLLGASGAVFGGEAGWSGPVPAADGGFGVERAGRVAPFLELDGSWHLAPYAIDEAALSFAASRHPRVPSYPTARAVAGVRLAAAEE